MHSPDPDEPTTVIAAARPGAAAVDTSRPFGAALLVGAGAAVLGVVAPQYTG
jgi:hypothetical protein